MMVVSALIVISFAACTMRAPYRQLTGFTQGTTYHITYEDQAAINYQLSIDSLLKVIDTMLSGYIPQSMISRINNNDSTVRINHHIKVLFNKSHQIWERSNGMFDITVGPLVNAWGFGPAQQAVPDSAQVMALCSLVGMEKISITADRLIKADPRMNIDFNAVAQGYSVDVLCGFFDMQRCVNYLVEIGGEVRTRGVNATGDIWRIGVDKPIVGTAAGQNLQTVLNIENCAVSTSGDYRAYFEKGRKRYGHTINPKTGYPAQQNVLSATIVMADCMSADGYATACMAMGFPACKALFVQDPSIQAYLIYAAGNGVDSVYMTPGMTKIISP